MVAFTQAAQTTASRGAPVEAGAAAPRARPIAAATTGACKRDTRLRERATARPSEGRHVAWAGPRRKGEAPLAPEPGALVLGAPGRLRGVLGHVQPDGVVTDRVDPAQRDHVVLQAR